MYVWYALRCVYDPCAQILPGPAVPQNRRRKKKVHGASVGKTVMIVVMLIIAAVIIALWQYLPLNIDGLAMTIIVYLIM